jgi:hypothetical protein
MLPRFASKGKLSFAPARVQAGAANIVIKQLLMIVTTADIEDAGTDDQIQLQIVNSDGLLPVNHFFPDTWQDDLERAQANFYFYYVLVNIPFSKIELRETAIRLNILGRNAWLPPERFFLFGLSEDEGGQPPEFVVPLVHLPTWPLSTLSAEPGEGQESVLLPILNFF